MKQITALIHFMDYNFEKYPLPICFDPGEERREMYRRRMKIEAIAERYLSIKNCKTK